MPLILSVVFVFNFKERKSQIFTKEQCVYLSVLMAGRLVPTTPLKLLFPSAVGGSQCSSLSPSLSDCSLQFFRFPFLPPLSLLLPLLSSYEHLRAQFLDWISPQNSRLTYTAATWLFVIPNYNVPTTAFLVFSQNLSGVFSL